MPRPLYVFPPAGEMPALLRGEWRETGAAADIEWESFIAAPVRLTAIRRVFALSGEYRHNTGSSSLPLQPTTLTALAGQREIDSIALETRN